MIQSEKENENIAEIKEEEKSKDKINLSKIEGLNDTMRSEKENIESNKIIKDTILTEEEKKESNRNTKTPENLSLIHNNSKNQEQGLDKNFE